MVGWSRASLAVALFLLYNIQLSDGCSVFCPQNENICTCDNGQPKPTPDPNGFIATDSCGGLIHYCSVGGECKPEENGCPVDLRKLCPQQCTLDYSPVCGSDGKTYSNECAMGLAACKAVDSSITMEYQGECTTCPLCMTLNSPVCGSDGVTYSSKCAVQSKACREQISLTVAYGGKCDQQCRSFCTFEYAPVCGTDGQTHSNECALQGKACRERSDLAVAYQGECTASGSSVRVPNLGPGALQPAWTQVENTDACLKKYKPTIPEDALHFEVCVPLFKPDECSQPTWWELATALDVVPKEELVSAKKPLYLEIEGVTDCLGSYQFEGSSHKESCLPPKRPVGICIPDSWDQLIQVWDGIGCPEANIQPLGANQRAPEYQSVTGWQKCLFDQQSGSYTTKCIPSYKPLLCSHNAYDELQNLVPTCSQTPRVIATPNAVTPPYLLIEGHELCLDTHSNGQYTVKCLPGTKPASCSTEVWERVHESFTGIPCPNPANLLGVGGAPPAYLSVNGFQDCLGSFQASDSHQELCLPASRPTACQSASWKQLKNDGIFKGIRCPLTGLPPMYLSVDGYKKCLSVYKATSTSNGLCLPHSKPRRCREKAWEQLQDYYHGIKCPKTPIIAGVGAPEYLSIVGHERCLSENLNGGFVSICMPGVKPLSCEQDSFNSLTELVEPLPACTTNAGLTGIPPAYLSIDGHEDCLGTITDNNGGHKEVCLPQDKPTNCTRLAWIGLQKKFVGKDCRPLTRGLGALPPRYLGIEGHEECLSQQKFSPNGHNEKCLPTSKPDGCTAMAWGELSDDGKFTGRQCRSTQIIGISAPLYTQVPGYEKCLESEQSLSGTHQELCLPSTKPVSCEKPAWNKLQKVFIGKDCDNQQISNPSVGIASLGGAQGLPPKYLSIAGHNDCLSSHTPRGASHSEICLPRSKPATCIDNSWNELKKQVMDRDLSKCQVIVGGGLGALPPKYLSINGYENCVDEQTPRDASHKEICLLEVKPTTCNSDSWDKLLVEASAQRIKICGGRKKRALPPKYLSVSGHSDCLSSHTPYSGATHTEICLPRGKPTPCIADSWDKLKVEVDGGRIEKCKQIVGGTSGLPPSYLSIQGHEKCLRSQSTTPGASHNEICLPKPTPEECTPDARRQLLAEVNQGKIAPCKQIVGGLAFLPPTYLAIEGHKKCLTSQSPTPGGLYHSEICLPKPTPQDCTPDARRQLLAEVNQGKIAPCRRPSVRIGSPPLLGSNPSSLPPKYLEVDGWTDCTRDFQVDSHQQNCLPLSKPSGACTSQAYTELMQITFKVDTARSGLGGILDAQPPEYLFVAGHDKCLDDISVGSHTEKCLPSNRPSGCESSTWIQIQNVFEGRDCKPCQKFCTRDYKPVCGSDGTTYPNKCTLEYTGCKEDRQLTVLQFGKCCPEICTLDYTPVCGSDGQIYSNLCALERAICDSNNDLKLKHKGECKAAQGTKQVGETCGSCFNPEANFDCGKCEPGLECVKDDESDLLPDLPSRCRVTLVFPRGGGVGDDCGPCFNPSANFDCGECGPGLECGATNPLLPDAPGKCQFARPPIPTGCNCGAQCEMLGGGNGLCQEDGQTCAQNILPPNCPVPTTPREEGESCGYSRLENCGNCGRGLECDTFVEDACGVCILKPVVTCSGATCGVSCSVPEPSGQFHGVCDGFGVCVGAIENPCVEHGCSGKQCGDFCLEGDVAGRCDSNGTCEFLPIDLQCDSSLGISCGSKVCTGSQKCCHIHSCEDVNSPIPPDPDTWTCEDTCFLEIAFCPPVTNNLKQEGESCGYSRREDCGNCDKGLECDTFVEDACGVCVLKPDPNPCCFRYGFGARMVPCCLNLISCDEHDELENNGPLVGGAMGKHHFCPNDAAHAHQLVSEQEPGYLYYKERGCDGRNEIFTGSVGSRDECSSKCNNDITCISFEYWGVSNPHPQGPNHCHLSNSCTYELSTETGIGSSSPDRSNLYVKEEQRTKCNNPGNSVPSPFDNCNTCRCSDDGFIDGCTEKFCVDECHPLSQEEGRCGLNWGGRCNKNLADFAVYCNLDNGWCGNTADHMNAQSGDVYDWESSACHGDNETSCYDECLGSGKGGRQCAAECSEEEELDPPYNELTYCNEDEDNGEAYCKEQTDDEFTFCHRLSYVGSCFMNNQQVEECDGICIPKDVPCDSDDDCKSIGSIHSGQVFSSCRNNLCAYGTGIAIA